MEYCCKVYGHESVNMDLFTENESLILVWTSVSKHYTYLPDKYQKIVCKAIGSALVDLPKPVVRHCEKAILSLLYNQPFGKWSTELF